MLEAASNTASGFLIGWGTNWLILPLFGFKVSASASFLMTIIFTVISVVRSYAWRRVFNKLHKKGIL